MPKHETLRYHQATLDLLGVDPIFSEKAEERIERAEKRCRCELPASMREWYRLRDANSLVSFRGYLDYHLRPRHCLLRSFVGHYEGKQPSAARLNIHLGILEEWYHIPDAWVILDGSPDPAVEEADKPEPSHFSRYVLDRAFAKCIAEALQIKASPRQGAVLGPAQLDFMIEQFEELPRQPPRILENPRKRGPSQHCHFRFWRPGLWVEIVAKGDPALGEHPADWTIAANSEEELFAALRLLWPCHGLALPCYKQHKPDRGLKRRLLRYLANQQ
jgi:hypothetical protein